MASKRNTHGTQTEHYALPLEVESGKWHALFRHLLFSVSLFVIVLLGVAAVSPVREVAIAEGQIIPESSVLRIQHYEGGIVDAILVQEGDIVAADQEIARLAPIAASSDFGQLRIRRAHHNLAQIRLRALMAGSNPDFSAFAGQYDAEIAEQTKLFVAETRANESEVRASKARIAQRESEFTAAGAELNSLNAQIEIYNEQLAMREKLLRQGYTSRRAYLETKAQLEQAKARLAQTRGNRHASESAIAETQSQLAQLNASKHREWSEQLADITAQVAELDHTIAKHRDRVSRLVLRAPVRGVIQEVGPKGVGEVIGAGDLVARLVPLGEQMVAEVRVKPEDIGHVEAGYMADIRLTAFESETYGKLKGKVVSLSPTTFESKEGEFYYRATLSLDDNKFIKKGVEHPVLPGMVVQAEIITGAKSVLKYLIKPVARAIDNSFSER